MDTSDAQQPDEAASSWQEERQQLLADQASMRHEINHLTELAQRLRRERSELQHERDSLRQHLEQSAQDAEQLQQHLVRMTQDITHLRNQNHELAQRVPRLAAERSAPTAQDSKLECIFYRGPDNQLYVYAMDEETGRTSPHFQVPKV